ncbi:MAG: RHS repeat-associated core domain-containing protein, partial [Bacilli bacterium]|nr:RHS repeat-associated core domain-containing protein [Bacilli bacterium]
LIKEEDLVNNKTKQDVYDSYGNILSKKTYAYNSNNLLKEDKYEYSNSSWQDLLTKFNDNIITYDEIGNLTSIANKNFTWSGRELNSYSDNDSSISFKYDLNGQRTEKIVNGNVTKYYLKDSSIVFENRNGSMIYYIYDRDEVIGFIYNGQRYFYHKNIFGDVVGIFDSIFNEIVTYEYDSWGALVNITDNSNINLGTINPFRYRSYYYDEETQLYYLKSRYYSPEFGRFINTDKFVSTGQDFSGNNMYQYCGNNPIMRKDSSGQWVIAALLIAGACLLLTTSCTKKEEPPKDYVEENSTEINCYAYAFGLDKRANPGDKAIESGSKMMPYTGKYVHTVDEAADYVLKDMEALDKKVRIVGHIDEAKGNEYIVALKVSDIKLQENGGYADYHFAVLLSDGTWSDKPGSTPSRWNQIDGTADAWDYYSMSAGVIEDYYNSESVYFAVEK